MSDELCKEDVTLQTIERLCRDCDEAPATLYLQVDLGHMITSIGDGEFCYDCGRDALQRIHALLPSRTDEN